MHNNKNNKKTTTAIVMITTIIITIIITTIIIIIIIVFIAGFLKMDSVSIQCTMECWQSLFIAHQCTWPINTTAEIETPLSCYNQTQTQTKFLNRSLLIKTVEGFKGRTRDVTFAKLWTLLVLPNQISKSLIANKDSWRVQGKNQRCHICKIVDIAGSSKVRSGHLRFFHGIAFHQRHPQVDWAGFSMG